MRAGGDEHGAGRQPGVASGHELAVRIGGAPGEPQAFDCTIVVDVGAFWREAFGKRDAFLQRQFHLLMIQGVRRTVDQPAAIGEGDTAPALEQLDDLRFAPLVFGVFTFIANCAGVCQKFFGDLAVFIAPGRAHRADAGLLDQCLVAREELFDLHLVVGERLGRGINCRQAAADHHHRQA